MTRFHKNVQVTSDTRCLNACTRCLNCLWADDSWRPTLLTSSWANSITQQVISRILLRSSLRQQTVYTVWSFGWKHISWQSFPGLFFIELGSMPVCLVRDTFAKQTLVGPRHKNCWAVNFAKPCFLLNNMVRLGPVLFWIPCISSSQNVHPQLSC